MNLRKVITDMFGLDGRKAYLEQYNKKFKKRPEQNIVVKDVLLAFEKNHKHILMEAPTGTGKTFIYAFIAITDYILKLPYAGDEITSKPYVCIVTNNKALQKQLTNDLNNVIIPAILSWFNNNNMANYVQYARDFLNVGTFKSKSNYLCSTAFERYTERNVGTRLSKYIKEEQKKQKTKSIDYDLFSRYDENRNIIADEQHLSDLSCKNSDSKTCKDPKCTCHRKLENYNIMITNYDYLFLLSQVMDLRFIGTLVLDECHNAPQKLINNTNEKFNIIDFNSNLMSTINNVAGFLNDNKNLAKNLPKISLIKNLSDNIKNNLIPNLKEILEKSPDESTANITFSIDDTVMRNKGISSDLKKLDKTSTLRLLTDEKNKIYEIRKSFGKIENIKDIIKIYKKTTAYRISDILDIIVDKEDTLYGAYDSLNSSFTKARIYNEYKKINELSENVNYEMSLIFEEKYEIDDLSEVGRIKEEEIKNAETAFEHSELVKSEYRTAKSLAKTLEQIILYKKSLEEMEEYENYLTELCGVLLGTYEKEYIENDPDVIILEYVKAFGNNNEELNIVKLNDNTEILYEKFLNRVTNAKIIYSSATMTTDGTYDFFMSQLGLKNDNTYKSVIPESPFKKEHREWMFISESMLQNGDNEYILTYKLDEIIKANPNGTLVLCTSKKSVNNAYECTKDMENRTVNSNATPLQTILDNVNSDKPSVIIGNIGFWEGLDLQGEAVTMVVMSKLPYQRPTEPQIVSKFSRELFKKIENRDITYSVSKKWWNYYNNLMKITFYQGVGRLLRGVNDYGVILCLFSEKKFRTKFNIADKRFGITKTNICEVSDMKQLTNGITMNMKLGKMRTS